LYSLKCRANFKYLLLNIRNKCKKLKIIDIISIGKEEREISLFLKASYINNPDTYDCLLILSSFHFSGAFFRLFK